ncbi:MAG TPA: hypothetical protein EYP14_16525, partial [Planctomycetaceae bacterium]|nr:hypothetical protein [Planctomycetaceae bacterium]
MHPVTVGQIADAIGATVPKERVRQRIATGIACSLATVQPGCVFWPACDPGQEAGSTVPESRSLDEAVRQAIDAGAVAAVVENGRAAGTPVLEVHDSFQALARWTRAYRRLWSTTVIAVTGDSARRSACEMIGAVLGRVWRLRVLTGPAASSVEALLQLLSLRPGDAFLLLELPLETATQIDWLCWAAEPAILVSTPVGGSCGGDTAEAIERLIGSLPPHGLAVLDADDPLLCHIGL